MSRSAEIERMFNQIATLTRERDEARAALAAREQGDCVPGVWMCASCGFVLHKMILRASDGAVGVDLKVVEDICPNDGVSMRPMTWKEAADGADKVGLSQMRRAEAAEARVEALEGTLRQVRELRGRFPDFHLVVPRFAALAAIIDDAILPGDQGFAALPEPAKEMK